MECVTSTELSVGVKVNFNTTYEFSLCQYMVLLFYYDSLVCCSYVCYIVQTSKHSQVFFCAFKNTTLHCTAQELLLLIEGTFCHSHSNPLVIQIKNLWYFVRVGLLLWPSPKLRVLASLPLYLITIVGSVLLIFQRPLHILPLLVTQFKYPHSYLT